MIHQRDGRLIYNTGHLTINNLRLASFKRSSSPIQMRSKSQRSCLENENNVIIGPRHAGTQSLQRPFALAWITNTGLTLYRRRP